MHRIVTPIVVAPRRRQRPACGASGSAPRSSPGACRVERTGTVARRPANRLRPGSGRKRPQRCESRRHRRLPRRRVAAAGDHAADRRWQCFESALRGDQRHGSRRGPLLQRRLERGCPPAQGVECLEGHVDRPRNLRGADRPRTGDSSRLPRLQVNGPCSPDLPVACWRC